MNAANRVPLRERKDIDVVLEVTVVIPKPLSAEASLVEAERVHHRAHRTVEDENPLAEKVAKKASTIGGTGEGIGRDVAGSFLFSHPAHDRQIP